MVVGESRAAKIAVRVCPSSEPRWAGDTNFMPVLADVKVLPEHLQETRRKLAELWPA